MGQHFSPGLDSCRGIPPAVWPAQGSSKSHRRRHSLDARAAGDSVGVVNQELTPFSLFLPRGPGRKWWRINSSQTWASMVPVSSSTYYLRFMRDAAMSAR